MNRYASLLAALLLATATEAAFAADEKATIARDTDLRSKALGDAPVVTALKASTPVIVKSRSGAWAQVTTADGKTGYVRLLSLRTSSGQTGDRGLGSLIGVFKTGASGQNVATGVKGMSAEELTTASPSPEQVEKLNALRESDKSARSAAALVGLKAKKVDYLAAPVKE